MKISTEEFIKLLQERPALWQKSHPNFSNRDIRNELLVEIGIVAGISVAECSKKLKGLKDSMRAQVAKLPKTKSGSPAFNLSDHISWPFFKRMMFMRDEFVGRKMRSNYDCGDEDLSATAQVDNYEQFTPMSAYEELSQKSTPLSTLLIAKTEFDRPSSSLSQQSWSPSGESSAKKPRCQCHDSTDLEERKLTLLEKVSSADELDTFVSDIANDLRKIKDPLKLMQAKAKIRRITEEFVISELLPSTMAPATD